MKEFNILIVGAGFFGSVIAERVANDSGKRVLLIENRNHLGGNSFSEVDAATGIEYHKYGSHIFHTSNTEVWNYINRFTEFNTYQHKVYTSFDDRIFTFPINLDTINSFFSINLKPYEVEDFIKVEASKENITSPSNLEEMAVSLVGRKLYNAFIRGYTIKQWQKDPKELSADIITRIPVRNDYNNRYFNDIYEGIPLNGYGELFNRMLSNPLIEIRLDTDYFDIKSEMDSDALTVYTGPIDRFFDYKHGQLEWRTIDLDWEAFDKPAWQGTSVINYADEHVPFTRIHEFKYYHPERPFNPKTLVAREYSRKAEQADEPYYPINTAPNRALYEKYKQESQLHKNLIMGGRLGQYAYFDMDDTIEAALKCYKEQIKGKI